MIPGIVAAQAGGGVAPDPHWASVRLLIHGPAGAVDASPHAEVLHTLTGVSVVGGALQFLGPTGGRVVTTTADATFTMTGAQTFTLEFSLKPTDASGGYLFTPPSAWPYIQWVSNALTVNGNFTGASTISAAHLLNALHHYAFIIETGPHRTRLYQDGVLVGSITATPSNYDPTMALNLFGCAGVPALATVRGQLSNVRFTRNVARYNSNYTVAVPFPAF